MPSLFALLHFNTQSHTKLPAKDLMQSLLYFRAAAFAEWKKLNKGYGAGLPAPVFFYNVHPKCHRGEVLS